MNKYADARSTVYKTKLAKWSKEYHKHYGNVSWKLQSERWSASDVYST
jgi:hypothetical protein